jgi:hypothetical protein
MIPRFPPVPVSGKIGATGLSPDVEQGKIVAVARALPQNRGQGSQSGANRQVSIACGFVGAARSRRHPLVLRKSRSASSEISLDLPNDCCSNVAGANVLLGFTARRHRPGKNRLPSAEGMVNIAERWRHDHRHTRICGRR